MSHFSATISPEACELAEPLFPFLRLALAALPPGPAAVIVLEEGCDVGPIVRHVGAMRELKVGHRVGAVPLKGARRLIESLAPALAPCLDQPINPGETWCIAVASAGLELAPLQWLSVAQRVGLPLQPSRSPRHHQPVQRHRFSRDTTLHLAPNNAVEDA